VTTQWLGKTTESVTDLGWTGSDFDDADANRMWGECCSDVRRVVLAEAYAGNVPWNILKNHARGIVLVALPGPPRTAPPSNGFLIHTSFDNGNYCYDGTVCTYEHRLSGCFISFQDPDFEGPSFYGSGA
jgi:hypothetical protein